MKRYSAPSSETRFQGPREMAQEYGMNRLSDLDLIQVLLGSGSRGRPVKDLAAQVLMCLDSSRGMPDPSRLLRIQGIGEAKAMTICAAVEFTRRLYMPEKCRIRHPEDAWRMVRHYADRPQETFLCLQLNGANEAVRVEMVSLGLLNRTLVHPREVFASAVAGRSASIMLAHNHPSGNLEPSTEDMEVTRRLQESGKTLGIPVLDHVIFTQDSFFSFMEHNIL